MQKQFALKWIVDGLSSTQQLLHFAKQLGGFAVPKFLHCEELPDLLALWIGYARDKLLFQFLVRVFLGWISEEILDFRGVLCGQGADYFHVFGFRGRNASSGELRLYLYKLDSGIGWPKWG